MAAEQMLTLCHQCVDETYLSGKTYLLLAPAEHPCLRSPRPRPAGAPWVLPTAWRRHAKTQRRRRTSPNPSSIQTGNLPARWAFKRLYVGIHRCTLQ